MKTEENLDPDDWEETRRVGHLMIDDMLDHLKAVGERPAWRSVPSETKAALNEAVPKTGPRTEEASERVAALGGLDEFRVVTAYFDRNLVESTAVEVAPGSFQFVASLILELDADIEDGDDTQLHFYSIVDEGLRDPFGKPIVDPDNSLALRANLRERRRDETTERNFLNDSLQALRGTGWGELLRRRLDALERKRG